MIGLNHTQKGFSLALALVFAGVLGATLANLSFIQSGENARREAEIAGIEGAQIARAARIFARDQFITRPNLVSELALPADGGTGPEIITVGGLINEALLPDNFGRENGGVFRNALGQPIEIWMANYPIDGVPTDPGTVPTAYVIFQDTPDTSPDIVQNIVQSIRAEDVAISTPLYNGATNLTGACNGGGDTVAIWETGCLDTTDYTNLTGNTFAPGSFVIPVWRAVNFDTRAFIRFPQPEQTGLQTMYTNLEMGNLQTCLDTSGDGVLDTNVIQIQTDAGLVGSGLCDADDDTGVDNRRDITNVNSVTDTFAVVVDPQAGPELSLGAVAEPANDFNIINALNVERGNAKIFNGDTSVGTNLVADRNITVSGAAAGAASSSIGGTLSAGNATFLNMNVTQIFDVDLVSVSDAMNDTADITARNDFVIQTLDRDGSAATINNITVGRNANIGGSFDIDGLTATGTSDIGGYSVITGNLNANDLSVLGNLNSNSLIDIAATLNTPTIAVTSADPNTGTLAGDAQCIGDCPKRRLRDQCQNLLDNGLLVSKGFVNLNDCIANYDGT